MIGSCLAALSHLIFLPFKKAVSLYAWLLCLCQDVLLQAGAHAGKGVANCLRRGLTLLVGGDLANELTFLSYAPQAAAGFSATAATAFHKKSAWTALALLDIGALCAVLWRHKEAHAEAAAGASVRRAAADPSNTATSCHGADDTEVVLLRCAALHSKAAYGVPAASGHVSSAAGFAKVLTIHQATSKAPRRISAASHLSAVQRMTGCMPSDVVAAHWQAHLHRPAYYVALHRQHRCVVVAIRGTLQLGDFCTVLDARPAAAVLRGVTGHVHAGFLAAARSLLPQLTAALSAAARTCPGWPVLLTGHSLGGGVAAVLTMLLLEEAEGPGGEEQEWRQLGPLRCVGVGAAAAFCQTLGMACKQHITSVLYGADCLPMFSVLGARMVIAEIHASSSIASFVGRLLCWARLAPGSSSNGLAHAGSNASSTTSSAACEAACGAAACRGLCSSSASQADSAAELLEIEAAGAVPTQPMPGVRHRRGCSSSWSSASGASLAAFAAADYSDVGGEGDAAMGLVPLYPPGRILWMLPARGGGGADATSSLGMYEMDQTSFQRFVLTLETAAHHLPDSYISGLDRLA